MLILRLAFVVVIYFLGASAHAQSENANCAGTQGVASDAVGFVVRMATKERISPNEYSPTLVASGAVSDFRVCIPLAPQRPANRGAVNIKAQIYDNSESSANAARKRAVEYENDTDIFQQALPAFRRTRSIDAYPSLDIQDYQNYHGCDQRRPHAIGREFHIPVDGLRTDGDPYRRKFVFRRDVRPTCDTPGLVFEFLEALPSFGIAIAVAAGRYDPRVEKIVKRRSAIVRYDLRGKPSSAALYMTYNLPRVGKDQCIRVEASDVFDGASSGSQVIGVACVTGAD